MKHIHFICRGNIYRSRLAEAYAKSKLKRSDDIKITSSGIEADLGLVGDISPETYRLAKDDGIANYLSRTWQQTTVDQLNEPDVIVFMNSSVYEDAKKFLDVPDEKTHVWHVSDVPGVYPRIKENVDALLNSRETNNITK